MEKIEKGISELKDVFQALQLEKERLEAQQKLLEVEKQKMADLNLAAAKVIKLNVGGILFITSRDTLMREKDTMLEVMFSGRHRNETLEDGSYFIDRDPTHFRYILNYLRDNGQIFLPNKKQFLSELLKECQFFNIEGLCEKIEGKLGKISDGSVEEDETKEDKVSYSWSDTKKSSKILICGDSQQTTFIQQGTTTWCQIQAKQALSLNGFIELRIDHLCPEGQNSYRLVIGVSSDKVIFEGPTAIMGYSGQEGYGIVCGTGNFFPTGAGKKLEAGDIVKIQRDKNKLTFCKNGAAVGNLSCSEKEILYPTIAVYYSGQVTILRGS